MLDTYPNAEKTSPDAAQHAAPSMTEQPEPPIDPASPTVPLGNEVEAAMAPASEQSGHYAPYLSPAGYSAPPPLPPYGVWMPAPEPVRPRRRWRGALMAVALLLALAIGAGGGAVIASQAKGSSSSASSSTVVLGAKSAPAVTVSSNVTSLQQNIETVAKAVEPSVVEVTSTGGQSGESIGSGDILTADGYIVTNDHVVLGYRSFMVTLYNGVNKQATLVGQDAQDDLAVLKISATGLTPIALADSSKATVGEFSIAIGSPLGLQNTATFGIVSALNRTASESPNGPAGGLTGLIQTSAPINPGNSGGALVNLQGQLIGIPTLSATNPETGSSANSIGYAISSNRVAYVTVQLIAHGSLASSGQGFIGIEAQDVTPQLAAADNLSTQNGVLVAGFTNDAAGQSPAQQAGLQKNDVITGINGQSVNSNSDLASALLNSAPGTKVTLTILRGTNQMDITITLGERPVNTQG